MNRFAQGLGQRLSRYLSEPGHTNGTSMPTRSELLDAYLHAGAVLLVEGT